MTFQTLTFLTERAASLTCSVLLAGGSGTGKTYSALRLARGLAGGKPFAFIDTESGRAEHYRGEFPEMARVDFTAYSGPDLLGFPPERWIAALDDVERAGYPVVVIDSFSHAWAGIGGLLECHQVVLDRLGGEDRHNMRAWAEVKPRWRRLIDRIIRARCHVVICQRAKPLLKDSRGKLLPGIKSKIRRPDLDHDIVGDAEIVFEMTAAFMMDPQKPGVPEILKCADQFKGTFPAGRPITEESGAAMARWATGSDDGRATKKLLDAARDAARKGKVAAKAFYAGLTKDQVVTVNTIKAELIDLAERAEAQDRDPFGDADAASLTDDPPIPDFEDELRERDRRALAG